MKQLSEILNNLFSSLLNTIENMQFFGCANIATELTHVSKLADFKDGVFIGEVFESTFIQIGELQRDFTVVNNEFILFKETTKADIQSIMKVYSDAEKNKTVIYDALKNIRYNATVLQLKTHSNCNPTLCTIR
ncbi:MAG: hypothetical protein FWC14_08310 [Candidatus Bathyarchaeota archaeon]|uniref:hypothetical protein n=1 Tax=Candidatus Bathycorpusculum sp. TaxID=2994959 RepID=UPI00282036A3|nr:hypothetical protein [Candidatus Termiticorpusculum sp.]MCL2291519.1 hypothetical protein [Candidatus Termiticorpusculum sp.]